MARATEPLGGSTMDMTGAPVRDTLIYRHKVCRDPSGGAKRSLKTDDCFRFTVKTPTNSGRKRGIAFGQRYLSFQNQTRSFRCSIDVNRRMTPNIGKKKTTDETQAGKLQCVCIGTYWEKKDLN